MSLVIAFFLSGATAILSPCILPVIPFVFARVRRPFASHGLPMLMGMAAAFALVASLATMGGPWAIALIQYARATAIVLLAVFGVTLLFPALTGVLVEQPAAADAEAASTGRPETVEPVPFISPLILGISTGLLWAPCAGPILRLILTTGTLDGMNAGKLFLFLAYAAGAALSLALALLACSRLLSPSKRSARNESWIRRASGTAVLTAIGAIVIGVDTTVLGELSAGVTATIEEAILERLMPHSSGRQSMPETPSAQTPDTLIGPALPRASQSSAGVRRSRRHVHSVIV